MRTMRKVERRTAAAVMAERTDTVKDLLELVKAGLVRQQESFEASGSTRWGYVSDMAEVEDALRRACHHLGMDVEANQDEDGYPIGR